MKKVRIVASIIAGAWVLFSIFCGFNPYPVHFDVLLSLHALFWFCVVAAIVWGIVYGFGLLVTLKDIEVTLKVFLATALSLGTMNLAYTVVKVIEGYNIFEATLESIIGAFFSGAIGALAYGIAVLCTGVAYLRNSDSTRDNWP